jgi:hypothetical protein
VTAELPREGRIGLVLSNTRGRTTVEARSLRLVEIGRALNGDEGGPDIAAVILSADIASSLEAKKSFFDLTSHRDRMLDGALDVNDGIWVLLGYVEELTTATEGTGHYSKIMRFEQRALGCLPEAPLTAGEHDYFNVPVHSKGQPWEVRDFRGMSGGGLWQVTLERVGGQLVVRQPLLAGVAFYQGPVEGDRSWVRCHGPQSIYRVVHEVLANWTPRKNR